MIQDYLSTLHQTSYELGLRTSHPLMEPGFVPCKVKLCPYKYAYALLDQPANNKLQVNFVDYNTYANSRVTHPKSRFAGHNSHHPPPQFKLKKKPKKGDQY